MATKTRGQPLVQARNDAYTGFLVVSLIAMIISCVLLGIDYSNYGEIKPPASKVPDPSKAKPIQAVPEEKKEAPADAPDAKKDDAGGEKKADAPGEARKGEAPKSAQPKE